MANSESHTENSVVREPNTNDVLCGRGGSINSHEGNGQFRSMVEKHRQIYLNARFKQEKRFIANTIVSEIRSLDPPGRFLTKDSLTKAWYDVGDEKARDKTAQALRENAPSLRAGGTGKRDTKEYTAKKKKTIQNSQKTAVSTATILPLATPSAYPPEQQASWGASLPPNAFSPYSYVQQSYPLNPPIQPQPQPQPCAIPTTRSSQQHQQPYHPTNMQPDVAQHYYQHNMHNDRVAPSGIAPTPLQQAITSSLVPISNEENPMHHTDCQVRHSPQPLHINSGEHGSPNYGESSPAPMETISSQSAYDGDLTFNEQQTQQKNRAFERNNPQTQIRYSPIRKSKIVSSQEVPTEHFKETTPCEESRLDETMQGMQIEENNSQQANGSLLTQVASHILGSWDTSMLCGGLDDTNDRALPTNSRQPPPDNKAKRDGPVTPVRRDLWQRAGSFMSDINSMAASVDMDRTSSGLGGTGWAAGARSITSVQSGASLGSRVSGAKMPDHDLSKVPSWEQSLHSMSFSTTGDTSLQSSKLESCGYGFNKLDVEDVENVESDLWKEYKDVRFAISIQQQENAAAFEVYNKRREAVAKSKNYRSARSGAMDRMSFVQSRTNSSTSDHPFGTYNPPPIPEGGETTFPSGTRPQEIADYNLALELQKFDQVGAGTVQQWERALREEREDEEARQIRSARSRFDLPY